MSKMKKWTNNLSPKSEQHSYSYKRNKKRKTDWAGISMGDAFKYNLEYYARLPAQRLFYSCVKSIQQYAIQVAKESETPSVVPVVKPQLSPFYTTYPASVAGFAAAGLTGFLEYMAHAGGKILLTYLDSYLTDPATVDDLDVNPDYYARVAQNIARTVQTRLVLEDLRRHKKLASIETFRIYAASQQNLRFKSVTEILEALILHGDLLPSWREIEVHPKAIPAMEKIETCCRKYFEKLPSTKSDQLVKLGIDWVKELCQSLAELLPKNDKKKGNGSRSNRKTNGLLDRLRNQHFPEREKPDMNQSFPPLNKPRSPFLYDPPSFSQQLSDMLLSSALFDDEGKPKFPLMHKSMQDIVKRFNRALEKAGGQNHHWEDMRSDLVENILRMNSFSFGPIEGNPTDGHQVNVNIGNRNTHQSEVFDRPVELSDDSLKVDALIEEAHPITNAMRRALYPNVETVPRMERLQTNGALDPARLAAASFSNAVFKRYRMQRKADKRGRPVLVIACDGSGSLNQDQMKMLKILTTAWLQSTLKSSVQILAGLYHSGQVRKGVTAPLVQWIYHPYKTPSISHNDTIRALVSLPEKGTGIQSDAPSIAFIMEEARKIAKGRMIYLILLTDCAWNKSFQTELTAFEEVHGFFTKLYEDFGKKLHTTLVALGVDDKTGFEELVEKVIRIPHNQLLNPLDIAEKIGVYVASCIKERTKTISGGS